MAEQLRKKWYQRKYEDKSSFRAVFTWYLIGMCALFLTMGIVLSEYANRLMFFHLNELQPMTNVDYFLFALFFSSILIACFLGFTISHRAFGPIYRLVKHMENFRETGSTEELKFREGDYFRDVADSYNKMLARIREKNAQ